MNATRSFYLLVALAGIAGSGCNSEVNVAANQSILLQGGVSLELVKTPRGFWIGKTEVTQAQWKAVMGDNPSEFKGDEFPVENVSWNDCKAFLDKLNSLPTANTIGLTFRFPTDAEWEYACRAGSTDRFCQAEGGAEITNESLPLVAWMKTDSEGKPHQVATKQPNAFGLFDMIGNVDEWVAETCGAVDSDAKDTEYAEDRVTRGGNFRDSANYCLSGIRGRNAPGNRSNTIGLRLCASANVH